MAVWWKSFPVKEDVSSAVFKLALTQESSGSPLNWSLGRQQWGTEEFCNKMRILWRPPGLWPWLLGQRGLADAALQRILLCSVYCSCLSQSTLCGGTSAEVRCHPQALDVECDRGQALHFQRWRSELWTWKMNTWSQMFCVCVKWLKAIHK